MTDPPRQPGDRPFTSAASAPLTCPECGSKLTGHWHQGREPEPQQCPSGHLFDAAWPGFTFEPETIIVRRPGLEA